MRNDFYLFERFEICKIVKQNMKGNALKKIIGLLFLFSIFGELVAGDGQVTILHTNDMHAQFVPLPATWMDAEPLPMIGGMVALEHMVRQARADYPQSLLLDAGDICTGTLLSKMEYKGALNGGFVEMMNLLDYDAFTVGNHEFDDGQDNLTKLLRLAQFDVISANLLAGQKILAPHAYKIYHVDSVRVGIIGLILTNLDRVTAKQNLHNITVADPAITAQTLIDEIDPKTDLIVLLTHQGDDNDIALAAKLKNADVIIGGHSHTRIEKARVENDVVIAQAGSKTRYLGRLTVDVAGDTITNFENELVATWVDSVKSPGSKMSALVGKFDSHIKKEYGRHINMGGTLVRSRQTGRRAMISKQIWAIFSRM
jgi:5'-nucleotidase